MRLILAVAGLLLLATPAFAHAMLRQADPPVGSTVHGAPAAVSISFSEAVEPRFSSITVADASGMAVDRHDVHLAPDDAQRLVVSLGPLPPGDYRVTWRVVSVDTHKTQGSFGFTVAP